MLTEVSIPAWTWPVYSHHPQMQIWWILRHYHHSAAHAVFRLEEGPHGELHASYLGALDFRPEWAGQPYVMTVAPTYAGVVWALTQWGCWPKYTGRPIIVHRPVRK